MTDNRIRCPDDRPATRTRYGGDAWSNALPTSSPSTTAASRIAPGVQPSSDARNHVDSPPRKPGSAVARWISAGRRRAGPGAVSLTSTSWRRGRRTDLTNG